MPLSFTKRVGECWLAGRDFGLLIRAGLADRLFERSENPCSQRLSQAGALRHLTSAGSHSAEPALPWIAICHFPQVPWPGRAIAKLPIASRRPAVTSLQATAPGHN